MTRRARRSSIRVFFDDTDAPTTTDKRPRHIVGDLWWRDSSNQGFVLKDADAGTWIEIKGPTASAIPHIVSVDFAMDDNTSVVVSRYAEVADGITLTIPSGSDLEIT